MRKACFQLSLFFFTLQGMTEYVSAQTCLQGDCKGGKGVMRIDKGASRMYLIGFFNRNKKLDGQGYQLEWGYSNLNQEADFLFALSQGMPSMESLWELKPARVLQGEFKDGLLQRHGNMLLNDINYFFPAAWLADGWLGRTNLKYIRFEGNFVNSLPEAAGKLTLMYPQDTLICVSDQLLPPKQQYANQVDQIEMVIDIRRNNGLSNELTRATFINQKQHGWAVIHRKSMFHKEGIFYRQLWCYGEKLYEDEGGAYPFDMDNPQTIRDGNGREITGPLVNGKVNGFGRIRDTRNEIQYEGYIKDNLPDGFGAMHDREAHKTGLFRKGLFEKGSWISWPNNRFVVTEGMRDQFTEGYLKESTYEHMSDYLAGKQPRWSYEGYMIKPTGWQGKVVSSDFYTKTEAWYDKGQRTSSNSAVDNIMLWQAYAKDGVSSIVVSYDPVTGEGILSDGKKINAANKNQYKPSKYNVSHYYDACTCGGDARTTKTTEVAGYTNTWTRTEQVTKSAVVGYWQGTQQVTSTYYTPGYTITTKVACENPNAVWAPYGVGTRHSVLRARALKE